MVWTLMPAGEMSSVAPDRVVSLPLVFTTSEIGILLVIRAALRGLMGPGLFIIDLTPRRTQTPTFARNIPVTAYCVNRQSVWRGSLARCGGSAAKG